MDIADFLLARIAEDEAAIGRRGQGPPHRIHTWDIVGTYNPHCPDCRGLPNVARALAECAAKREIVELHANWPVLVEKEPEPMSIASDLSNVSFKMTRQMNWLTEQEYIKRFGHQPPTAPMIRALATVYADHPEYQQEWSIGAR